MQFVFIQGSTVLIMPVTPEGYEIPTGRKMETINISGLGDVFRPGGRSRFGKTLTFLLPAQEYTFMEPGTRADPQFYLDQLNAWSISDKPVRLVITETQFNLQVFIENVTVREKDGTADRYVDVSIREYVDTSPVEVSDPLAMTQGFRRSAEEGPTQEQTHTIAKGDTLAMICRRYYGNGTAKYYKALAAYNSIKNPALIYAGRTIKIPTEAVLLGGAS